MREIKYIVIHCTATPLNTTLQSIQNHWRNVLGWKSPGYHLLIAANGMIHELQPLEKPANGVRGYNAHSIHVSTIGGHKVDDRTAAQKDKLWFTIKALKAMYPNAEILGHRDFHNVAKSCPRYNAKEWFDTYIPLGG